MPYNIDVKGYTYKVFQEPNEIQFGQKHQVNQREDTPKCDTQRLSKLYQNQHMIDSITHQHMKWDINRNQIKQHMRDKTPIEKDTN